MQIRPGGEKLSDTKVGEFDRRALLHRLSAMPPMRRTLRPIITDAAIRSAAACWRWSRPSPCTEQKQEGEQKLFHFRWGFCIFPVLLSGNEQMVINAGRVNLPSSRQVFPADTIFSVQGRKWNFSQRCITSRSPHPSPPHRHLYLFIRISFAEGKRKEPPLHLQKEKLSGAITQRAHQSWYTPQ